MKKLLISCLSIMLIFCMIYTFSEFYAVNAFTYSGTYDGTLGDVCGADATIGKVTSTVLDAVRYAGYGISLIMLTYIFIKYMLSGASEKAEVKKNLIPFVIGAVILFAASSIVGILKEVANGMFD